MHPRVEYRGEERHLSVLQRKGAAKERHENEFISRQELYHVAANA